MDRRVATTIIVLILILLAFTIIFSMSREKHQTGFLGSGQYLLMGTEQRGIPRPSGTYANIDIFNIRKTREGNIKLSANLGGVIYHDLEVDEEAKIRWRGGEKAELQGFDRNQTFKSKIRIGDSGRIEEIVLLEEVSEYGIWDEWCGLEKEKTGFRLENDWVTVRFVGPDRQPVEGVYVTLVQEKAGKCVIPLTETTILTGTTDKTGVVRWDYWRGIKTETALLAYAGNTMVNIKWRPARNGYNEGSKAFKTLAGFQGRQLTIKLEKAEPTTKELLIYWAFPALLISMIVSFTILIISSTRK
ncbi:MAG: hypothetical protein DRO11_04695 [Methanobacteriota archaeon]|nr:MAG: hypothetical protein DRO11_04695 [Euryarchaeota archaeon]